MNGEAFARVKKQYKTVLTLSLIVVAALVLLGALGKAVFFSQAPEFFSASRPRPASPSSDSGIVSVRRPHAAQTPRDNLPTMPTEGLGWAEPDAGLFGKALGSAKKFAEEFLPPSGPESRKAGSTETETDEELFHRAYPDYYLAYLYQMQELMRREGALEESQATMFRDENDIVAFLNIFARYLARTHVISPDTLASALQGINVTMRELNTREALLQ
ncbi:MAG: hypothetical protein HYU35_01255, partial [Parcubacteria group bacterium]|nr:hypothetical protein [Parcubacteria group bacterium]